MAQQSDRRSEKMKREMAEHFAEFEQDYRDEDWCSIVAEDSERAVIVDYRGHEHSEWADEFSDEPFSEIMHEIARETCDYDWCASWPVVFDKLE